MLQWAEIFKFLIMQFSLILRCSLFQYKYSYLHRVIKRR
jgi:hypothetical protein